MTLTSVSGTSGDVLTSAGSGNAPTWTTPSSSLSAATQAQMETATSNTVAATPSNTQYHPGVAKAWLKCGITGNILGSHNITSITDTGVGLVSVTLDVDFSSSQYAVVGTPLDQNGTLTYSLTTFYGAGSSFSVDCRNAATVALVDPAGYSIVAFGDQ